MRVDQDVIFCENSVHAGEFRAGEEKMEGDVRLVTIVEKVAAAAKEEAEKVGAALSNRVHPHHLELPSKKELKRWIEGQVEALPMPHFPHGSNEEIGLSPETLEKILPIVLKVVVAALGLLKGHESQIVDAATKVIVLALEKTGQKVDEVKIRQIVTKVLDLVVSLEGKIPSGSSTLSTESLGQKEHETVAAHTLAVSTFG